MMIREHLVASLGLLSRGTNTMVRFSAASKKPFGMYVNELLSSGLYVEYDYPEHISGDLSVLGGGVRLLDQLPPVFTNCPAGSVVDVPTMPGLAYGRPTWAVPVATDNSGDFELTSNYAPSSTDFALRAIDDPPYTIRYIATDAFDNAATWVGYCEVAPIASL